MKNVKLIVASVVLSFAFTVSNAQWINFGPRFGVNMSTIKGATGNDSLSTVKGKTTIPMGLFLVYGNNAHHKLSADFIYSPKGELVQKRNALASITNYCKTNNIELILAIPPNFKFVTIGFADRLKTLTNGYATVWQYDQKNLVYSNPDYFFDNHHLRTNGSYVFTNELVKFYAKQQKL